MLASLASLAAPSRWTPTRDCAGVPVNDVCWVLGGPGQSCPDMCGGSGLVDQQTTMKALGRLTLKCEFGKECALCCVWVVRGMMLKVKSQLLLRKVLIHAISFFVLMIAILEL